MRDLGELLRDYVDEVAPPIAIAEVEGRADEIVAAELSPSHGRRARWWPVAAAATIAVALAGVVVVARDPGPEDEISGTGPPSPTTAVSRESLTPFGVESPMPDIPAGWKTLDFADFRFAVPERWIVPIPGSCEREAPGVVLVWTGDDADPLCAPAAERAESVVMITPAPPREESGTPVVVGTWSARRYEGRCFRCPDMYVLDNGYQVSVRGPHTSKVLSTFTDSGTRRVLQSGRVADASGWRTVEYGRVVLRVPAEWTQVDLSASYTEHTHPDGSSSIGGTLNPGECGGSMFEHDQVPKVFLGVSPIVPGCPAWLDMDLEPADGVWIRSITDEEADSLGRSVATLELEGLDVMVVRVDRMITRTPSPVLDLLIRSDAGITWISLGVGFDASTARAIVGSLRAAS